MARLRAGAAPALVVVALLGCLQRRVPQPALATTAFGEHVRVLALAPGVTATVVTPPRIDTRLPVPLILYALPNGNSTAETMGHAPADSVRWRFDIQHIAAQTRALRTMGLAQAVVVYLEADSKSWPEWRRRHGHARANARIATIVEQLRIAAGNPRNVDVTLTGHSGGGSFIFGFIEAQPQLPDWVTRIAFLDANYNFDLVHGERIAAWLRRDTSHTLVVLAYDDREITLNGRKVVSDSGGTWRASERMIANLGSQFPFVQDTVAAFVRYRHPQIELLLHPNPDNRILHTAMIGDMNGYMHAMLLRTPAYGRGERGVLGSPRAYVRWVGSEQTLPAAGPPPIPARSATAIDGPAFITSVATLPREAREDAILHELLSGNIPDFLRGLQTVTDTFTTPDGRRHEISYDVMPDYLAIGSDRDYVRMPMNPYTAQAFCDAYGFVLPTRRMVNAIWRAAPIHVEPRPLTQEREAPVTFLQHHSIIEAQLGGKRRGFVAGIKKDVVVSNQLLARANRVAIYGWHYLNGQPIQPLYSGHVDWYVDYSHGIRPVRRLMRVDGVVRSFEQILADSSLSGLLSDEGVIARPRY